MPLWEPVGLGAAVLDDPVDEFDDAVAPPDGDEAAPPIGGAETVTVEDAVSSASPVGEAPAVSYVIEGPPLLVTKLFRRTSGTHVYVQKKVHSPG